MVRKASKTSDVQVAPTRDRKSRQKVKKKVEDDNDDKKDVKKEKSSDGKSGDKGKRNLEDGTDKVSKKHKTAAEKDLPMKNDTGAKKDLKKQTSSDGKSGDKSKRNSEDGATNVSKKHKAKKQLPPKEVESSISDEDSSGSMEKDGTAKVSKKHKTAAEKDLPMKNDTGTKKDLIKQTSSDGKSGGKGKRNSVDGTTNISKKRKAKSSISDEDPSDSMEKPNTQASGSEPNQPNTFFAAKPNSIIVGNLAHNVNQKHLRKFFQVAGKIVGINLPTFDDGTCVGSAQVEFATNEAVHKACKLNGLDLKGRAVSLNFGHERLTFNPDSCMFKKPPNFSSDTVLIKGFDAAYAVVQITRLLKNHFSSCGVITKTLIPVDIETGASKGALFMEFRDQLSVSNALKLNGSRFDGGLTLSVEEAEVLAEPRANNRSFDGGRGGRRGGRGRGGRQGGRGRGGRRGGRS
ncbi:nucleolin 2-like [Lolium rigidum]|uniref:nucleolin 2-like n=1 Tax=Lolium rigidum TaxID=89674 RepID=UPI001F5D726F|nr:nucleolin 2-like [Lolium rigidum]